MKIEIEYFLNYLSSWPIHFANNLFSLLVQTLIGITLNAGHRDAAVNVQVLFTKVDAGDGDVGAAFPGSDHGFEGGDLRVRAGLVAVEPRGGVLAALVLHLALAGALTPAAFEFLVQ